MAAVGVFDDQVCLSTQELVDGLGCRGAGVHAFPIKVAVAQGRVDEEGTRGQGSQELLEVERDFLQFPAIIGHTRHVADLAPSLAKIPVVQFPPL